MGLLFLGRGARSAGCGTTAAANAMSCVAVLLGVCGTCLVGCPRHRCVVSCAVRTRCVTARGSVGVRLWLFCERGQEFGLTATSAAAAEASPATSRGRGGMASRAKYACRSLLVSYMPLADESGVSSKKCYYEQPVALDWACTQSQLSIESAACGAGVKTHRCRLYNDSN